MSDKIKVAVKVRPLIPRELDKKLLSHWQIKNDTIFLQDPTGKQKSEPYVFDHIFSPTSTNNDIFDTIVKPIIDAAIEGFNGTVFAYGQTSSGKTYTMTGRKENPGIIPLTIHYMFHAINQCPGREFLLRVSYMEIYNEKVNDLISLTENLPVREDSTGQVFVAVNEKVCNSPDIVLEYMNKGEKNRRFGETDVNERSSRSHTILRIILESRTSDEEDGAVKVSHLNLVDLAGSERAGQSGATGDRFKEGCHINSSLTTLGLVIKQLSEGCLDGRQFISFRDSKLTRLLQSSLGGNAMTAIICTVTPAMIDQTMDTLNFASRAKKIKNKPQLNEVLSDAALIKRYRKQIAKLYEELENTKLKCVPSEVQEIENKLQQQEKLNQTLSMRINRLKQALINTSVDLNMHGEMKKKKYSNRRKTWGGPAEVHRRSLAYTSTLDAICESPGKIHHSFSTTNLVTDIRTPMEEFEIDLMTQEENDSIKDSWKNETNQSSVLEGNESSFFCTENTTAETPPKVLRERIKRVSSHFDELQSEYDELKKFARLEKQIYHTDGRQFEKENQELTEKLNQLTQTVETLEVEKCELENNIAQKDIKLSSLEMQVLNFEVTSEILRKNFSEREAELKKSLEEAWATLELKDASISQLTENMSALQQGMKISADEDGKTNKMLSVQTSLIDDLQDRIEQLNNEKIKYKLLLEEKNAEIMQIQKEHVEVCKHFNNKIKELETSLLKQISMHKIQYSDDDDNVMESDTIKKLQAEITELKCDDYKLKMVLSGLVLNQEETDDHDCKKEIIEDLDLSACNKEFSDIQLKIENLIDNLICTEYRGNEELCQEVELMSCVEATGLMQQIENLVDNLLSTETDYSQEETVYTQVRSIDLRQKQLTELQTDMEMKDKETTDLLNQLEDLLVNTEDLQKHNEKLTQQLTGKKLNSEKHQMCNDVTSEYHKSQKLLAVSEVCHFQENNGHLGLQSSVSVVTHREDASSLQELRANLNEKLVLLETKIQEADDLRKCNEELRNQLANMETHLPEDIVKQREEFMQTLALLKRVSLEKEHLEKQYQKLEEKLSLLESKSEELKESQKHNEELVKQSAVMVFRIQDLEQYIQKLMEQVDIKESRIQRLKKCNKELSEQLDTMEGKIQELEECQKQNKELLKQSAFMVVKIQDLEQYAKKLLEDVDSKDSRIQSLKKCNEVITHELDTVEAKVQGLEEYQKQNEELLKQSAFMIVKIQDLEQYVEKLIGWVDSKESRIQTLMESNKAMSKQVGTMEGMFHELKEFRKQNEELLKQLAYMVVKIQDLEQYTENLFGQLDNKESTIQNLRKCNEMMSEQLDMMEDRFQYLEVYQKQNEELVKQLAFMTLSVQDLEQYTEKLMADVESRDSKVQSLEKCNEMMSQQFDVMEGRFQDLDECQKQNEELLKQSAFMVVKIQNLERYNKELMEWVNSKESGIQSLKKSNEVLSEQLETMKTNFQELEECRKQNEELVKQSAFMVVKIQDLEQYAEKLIGCVDSNELKIQRIKKSNEVMSEQLDMMEGRCQDMGEYQKQNEELVRQLGFMVVKIQDLEQYTEKLMCNVDSKNLRIQSLKKCNEMMSEQLETVETKFQELEEYREQNEELLKQLAFMVIKIQDLQNYNAKIKEQAHENDSKLYYLHRHNQIETETEEVIRNHPFGIQPEETVSLQEINSHLIEEQETKTQDIISLQNLNKELTNNVDKKTQELIVTEKQCHKLTEQLSEFDIQKKKEVGTLKEEIIILQTEKNLLEKKLKEAVKERNDMETQINELNYIVMVQKQNHSLTDKLMNVDAKQEEINTLQKETVKLRRELKLLKTAMGDLVCDLKLRLMILDESLNFVQYTADICAEDKQILKDIFDQEQLKSMSDIKTLLLKLKAENNILQDKLNGPQIPTETEITENVTITNTITPEMSNEDICTEMKDMEITVCDMTIPPVNDATCYYNATIIEETLQSFCINNTMQILDNDQTVREYEQILNEKLKAFDELEKKFHSLNTEHDNLRRINYELTEKLKVFENMCIEVYELRKQNLSLEEKTKDVERFKEEVNCLRTENNQFVEKLNYLKDVQLNLDELNTKFNNLQNLNDELTEKLKMYDCIKYEMSQLAVINASLEEKLQKCKQMEDDFNALKVEYEKQLSVNIDLNDKLNSMEAMKNEYVSVKAHIKDLEEEFKEAESLKNDMNSIRSENEELLNINNELNEKLNTLQNENSDLKQLYTDLEENIKDFENTKNELISAKDEHEKLLNKLEDLEEKLKENENFKNDLILVKSENEKLVKMNNDLDEKLITLEEVQCQYMEFQTTNIDLKEKLELLKNEVIQLKNDNEKLINVNCDLSKKITGIEEVQKAYTKLCADLEEKVKEIEIMKSDKISIEAEKEQLFMVNNELNEKLTTLRVVQEQYIGLKRQFAELEESIKDFEILKNSVTSFKSENEELMNANRELKEKIVSLESIECEYFELKTLNADFEERIKYTEILKSEVLSMKSENEKLLITNSNISEKLDMLEAVHTKYIDLCADVEEKIKEIEVLKTNKALTEAENEKLLNLNSELTAKLAILELIHNECSELKVVNSDLQERVKEIEVLKYEVASVKIENQTLLKANIDLNEKLTILEPVKNKYIDLRAEIQEKIEEIDTLKSAKESTDIEIEKLLNLNSDLNEKLSILEQVQSECTELKVLNSDLEERVKEIAVLKCEMASVKTENEKLSNANSDLSEKVIILEQIQNKYDALCADVEEKIKEIEVLKINKVSVEAENKKLLNVNNELNEKLTTFENIQSECAELKAINCDLQERVEEIEKLKTHINSVQNENENLSAEINQVKKVEHELYNLRAENSDLQKANADLTEYVKEVDHLQKRVNELCAENDCLNEKVLIIAKLQQQVSEASSEYDRLTIINDDLNEKLNNFESKINSLQVENEQKNNDLENANNCIKFMETENSTLSGKLQTISSELHVLMSDNEKMKDEIRIFKSQNNELKMKINELETYENENNNLMEKLESVQSEVNELSSQNNDLTEKLKYLTDLENTVAGLKVENEQLSESVSLMKNVKDELNTLHAKYNDQLAQNDQLIEKLKSLESENTEFSSLNSGLEEKLKFLECEISSLRGENGQNLEKLLLLKRVEQDFNNLNSHYNDVLVQNNELAEKLKSLENKIGELSSQNADLQEMLKDFKNFENEILAVRTLNDELTGQISTMKNIEQDFCNLNVQFNETLTQNNELSEKLKAMENDIYNIRYENTQLKEDLRSAKQLELVVEDLTRQNSTLNSEVSEKVKHMEEFQNEVSNLKKLNEELTKHMNDANTSEAVKSLHTQNQDLIKKSEESNNLQTINNDFKAYLTLHTENDAELNISKNANSELEEKITTLLNENKSLFESLEDSRLLKKTMIKEICSLSPGKTHRELVGYQLTNLYMELMSVFLGKEREVITSIQKEYDNKMFVANNKIEELQNMENKQKKWIEEVEKENDHLTKELAQTKDEKDVLNKQLTEKSNEFVIKCGEMTVIQTKLTQAQSDAATIQLELDYLKQKYKINMSDVSFSDKIEELGEQLSRKEKLVERIREELNAVTVQKRKFQKMNEEATVKCTDLIAATEGLKTKLAEMEELNKKLTDDLQCKSKEVSKLCFEMEQKKLECDQHLLKIDEIKLNATNIINCEYKVLQEKLYVKDNHSLSQKLKEIVSSVQLLKTTLELLLEKCSDSEMEHYNRINVLENGISEKTDEINKLTQEIKNLHKQFELEKSSFLDKISELEQCLKQKDHDIDSTDSEKLTLNNKLKELEQQIILKESEVDKLSSENLLLQNRISDIHNQLSSKLVEIKTLQELVNSKSNEYLTVCNQLNEKQKYIDEINKEKRQLLNKCDLLTTQSSEEMQVVEKLKCEKEKANNEIRVLKENDDKKQKALEDLDKLIKLEKQENAKLKVKQETLLRQLESVEKKLLLTEKNLSENRDLKSKISILEDAKSKLQHEYDDMYKIFKASEREKNVLLQKEQEQITKLKFEIRENKLQIDQLLKLNNEICLENETLQKQLSCLKNSKDKEIEVLQIIIKQEKHGNTKLKLEHDLVTNQLEKFKKKLSLGTNKMDSDTDNHFRTLQEKNEELRAKILELEETKIILGNKCEEMSKIIEANENESAGVFRRQQELVTKLKSEINELKINTEAQLKHNKELTAENESLKIQVLSLNNREPQGSMDTEIVKIKKENEDLKSKIAELEEAKGYLDEECEEMYKMIQANEKEMTSVLKREAEQVKKLKSEIQKLEEENEAQLKHNKELINENESLKTLLSNLKKTTNRDTQDNIDTDVAKLKKENNDLKSKIAELEEAKGFLNEECEEMYKMIQANEKEMTSILKREEEQVTKLKYEIDKLKEENEGQLKHNKELTNENESLKTQLSVVKNTKDKDAQGNVDSEISKLQEENKDLKSKITELEEAKGYLDEECEEMYKMIQANEKEMCTVLQREQEQVTKLKSEVEQLKVKLEELQSVNESLKKRLSSFSDDKNKELEDLQYSTKIDKQDNRKLKLKQESLLRQIEELGYKNECLEKKLSVLETSSKSVTGECDKCDKLHKLIQANEKKTNSILSQDHEQMSKLKNEIEENKLKTEELAKLNKEVQNQNDVLKLELSRCENFVRELRSEKRQLLNQLTESKAKAKCFETQLNGLLKEKENLAKVDNILDTDTGSQKQLNSTTGCQCEQLRKQVTQLKLNLADGNAKITGLELQIQNDYKKRVQDLEKSLDQAKHKINDLKTQVRRFQNQMNDVTVRECEVCHRRKNSRLQVATQTDQDSSMSVCSVATASSSSASGVTRRSGIVENASIQTLQGKLKDANTTIDYLKKLCRMRNAKIQELDALNKSRNSSPRSVLTSVSDSHGNITTTPKQN